MKFTRMGMAKIVRGNYDELWLQFLQGIVDIIEMEEIPVQLIINLEPDMTKPVSSIKEQKGSIE